eukprot:4749790-Amphidinium_carterae.1
MQADVTSTDHFGVQTDITLVHAADGTSARTGHISAHSSEWEPQRSTCCRVAGGVDASIAPSGVSA